MQTAHALPAETGVDQEAFRLALSRFATGIALVTTRNGKGDAFAITINAFSSVSLDPPLVLFCLGRSAFHYETFARAETFAVNVLSVDQQALSDRFAREAEDHFPDLETGRMATGSPILTGCLAALDCRTEACHEAGDHLIIIGRVDAVDISVDRQPLIYFGSRYGELKPGGER
ncbi:MAG: flavin reductase family protein [Pseudomonadota bacterium]